MCDSLNGGKITARQRDIEAITQKLQRPDLPPDRRVALQFHLRRLRSENASDAAEADRQTTRSTVAADDPVARWVRASTLPEVQRLAHAALNASAGSDLRERALAALRQTLGVAANGNIVPAVREWLPGDTALAAALEDAVETHAASTFFAAFRRGRS